MKRDNRFQNLIFIVFAILTLVVFLRTNTSTKEYTYLIDEYNIQKEMLVSLDIQVLDDGSYESEHIEGDKLLIYDFETHGDINMFNLKTHEMSKISERPEPGRGYSYSGKVYDIYSQYFEVWDEKNNLVSKKKMFADTVYSSVYYENIAVVSLYRYGGIHGVDINTERIVWSIYDENKLSSHMNLKVIDGTLYYLAKGTIYALAPQNGEVLMEKEGDFSEPYMIEDSIMYTSGENLKRVDMNTWETLNSIDTEVYSIVSDEQFIYVIDYPNEMLRKINKVSFEQEWETKIYTSVAWKTVMMDSYIGVVNHIGQVALVSKKTGDVVWVNEFDSSHRIYGYHDELIVINKNGRVRIFEAVN